MAKRFYLECPFDEKDMCKNIGGRWDMDERKWYVPAELDPDQFRRWWPADASESKMPSLKGYILQHAASFIQMGPVEEINNRL